MDDLELKSRRADKNALEQALRDAGFTHTTGNAWKCIVHGDKHASGSVYEKDGAWHFKCMTATCGWGGDLFDVMAWQQKKPVEDILRGLSSGNRHAQRKESPRTFASVADLEEAAKATGAGNCEGIFTYTNPETKKADMIVVRLRLPDGGKKFWQNHLLPDGRVEMTAPPKPWPIYNRTRVKNAGRVLCVEGELKVHALAKLGIVATTSPGGANNAENADWTPLAGKEVFLWPDKDEAGIGHMQRVAGLLEKLRPEPTVFWIEPPDDLKAKGDVVDYVEMYAEGPGDIEGPKAAIDALIASATTMGAAAELRKVIEDTISGKRLPVPWPFAEVSDLTQSLLPGTVTMLCGDPESGKSLVVMEALYYWRACGVDVACYELEDDRSLHMMRFLAQVADNAKITNAKWARDNPAAMREAMAKYQALVDALGKCVFTAPDNMVTMDVLGKWVRQQAAEGKRIIVIDPITAAEVSGRPWQDDKKFLIEAKAAVRQYGASLVLVTHPRIGQNSKPGLASLAGGAAYPRFSHTVMWLHKLPSPKRMPVSTPVGTTEMLVSRTLRIFKARNASGGGSEIAFNLDTTTLKSKELGVVVKKNKDGENEDSYDF